MVSAGGQLSDDAQRLRNKEHWWADCVPDGLSDCVPDCLPDCDCMPCDLGLVFLAALALNRPGRPARTRPTAPARAGMLAIRGYRRWLSHRLPTRCRHTPTCSSYGLTAVGRYGLVVGSRLTAGRLRRCKHPTPHGTVDQVP